MEKFIKNFKNDKRGVALILTLSVLAMILVLVVAFAMFTRTETVSASNYKDQVASRFLAQGALNRAIATIAMNYSANNSALGQITSLITNDCTFSAYVT